MARRGKKDSGALQAPTTGPSRQHRWLRVSPPASGGGESLLTWAIPTACRRRHPTHRPLLRDRRGERPSRTGTPLAPHSLHRHH